LRKFITCGKSFAFAKAALFSPALHHLRCCQNGGFGVPLNPSIVQRAGRAGRSSTIDPSTKNGDAIKTVWQGGHGELRDVWDRS
jgi:hypothetical protein